MRDASQDPGHCPGGEAPRAGYQHEDDHFGVAGTPCAESIRVRIGASESVRFESIRVRSYPSQDHFGVVGRPYGDQTGPLY